MSPQTTPAAAWKGPTGDAYFHEHQGMTPERRSFWHRWEDRLTVRGYSVLEVGAGTGENLRVLSHASARVGVDLAPAALRVMASEKSATPALADAAALPFGATAFDWVITAGCLIHVPGEHLPAALREVGRVASRDVLLLEYDDTIWGNAALVREIPWRGYRDVCWARPYARLFAQHNPDFTLLEHRPLPSSDGWDRVVLAHLRRSAPSWVRHGR